MVCCYKHKGKAAMDMEAQDYRTCLNFGLTPVSGYTMCVLCISILLWTTYSTAARNLWLCFWCFLSHLYVSNQAWCGLPRCYQTTTIISRMDLAVVLMQWASIEQWSISDRIIIYIFICKLVILFQWRCPPNSSNCKHFPTKLTALVKWI